MDWRIFVPLILLLVVFHHGITVYIYTILMAASFFLGLVVCMERVYCDGAYTRRECASSKGIPAVIEIMGNEGVPKPKIKLSLCPSLDAVLNQIISYILRDYINSWYTPLTSDTIFPCELQRLLQQITSNVTQRISETDWIPFTTKVLPSILATHIRLYRSSCEKQDLQVDRVRLFFDCEADDEKTICRESVCLNRDQEGEYLRSICDRLLLFILPREEFRVPAIRYIAREVLLNTVLLPTIDLLSDPDFVNRSVAWFALENSFTSEYFIQALKISENAEELEVVIQQVTTFMDKLRGHDTGGVDDALIKAQLSSLDYLHKTCSVRLQEIKEGLVDKPFAPVCNLQPGVPLYDMPFSVMMSSSVAFVSFLDFLTSIDKHSLLRLYLDCMSYRENVVKLYSSQSSTTAGAMGNSVEIYSPTSTPSLFAKPCANEMVTHPSSSSGSSPDSGALEHFQEETMSDSVQYFAPIQSTNSTENGNDNAVPPHTSLDDYNQRTSSSFSFQSNDNYELSETVPEAEEEEGEQALVHDLVGDIRAFGVHLCSNLLQELPSSAEPLVQQALRSITKVPEYPDPDAFKDLETKLLEILSDTQCFQAFKKSPRYIQLLSELGLLRDSQDSLSQSAVSQPETGENPLIDTGIGDKSPPGDLGKSSSLFSNFFSGLKAPSTVSSGSKVGSASTCNERRFTFGSLSDMEAANRQLQYRSAYTTSTAAATPTHTYTANIARSEIMQDSYVMYTIKVTRTAPTSSGTANVLESWQTMRRFSHFAELHSLLTELCGRILTLKLPSKRAFSNTSRDFLVRRRQELDEYLSVLCSTDVYINHPSSRTLIVEFLQPGSWERGRNQSRGVSAILLPLKIMGNAMMAMPDTLADGISRMVAGGPQRTTSQASMSSAGFSVAPRRPSISSMASLDGDSDQYDYSLDPSTPDDSPIGMLFLLVDELFNLNRKKQLTRHGNFVILRRIFQAFSGPRVNRMIISKVSELLDPEQVATFVAYLRDSVWLPAESGNQATTHPGERTSEVKLRTRVLCRTMLLGTFYEFLTPFLGVETTRRGANCLFKLLQSECFNRRFVHVLLEAIICHMFRPHRSHWESLFEEYMCPGRSGRSCRVHVVNPL